MRNDGAPQALLFAEFDNRLGRTLSLQEPPGYLSTAAFDAVCDVLIPKPQLCNQLLVLRDASRSVLCWPVCLEGAQYERSARCGDTDLGPSSVVAGPPPLPMSGVQSLVGPV